MEVRVKLLLQGGHGWEFCCKDDDPIVFGLVSALPGADIAGNLPPDGLVQIETRTGERLFLTRSSLVSVEIAPVVNPLTFLGIRRLATVSANFPTAASVPSPFMLVNDALPDDVYSALLAHALSQDTEETRSHDGVRELKLGPLEEPIAKVLRSLLAQSAGIFGTDHAEVELRLRLFAIGDAQAVFLEPNSTNVLNVLYHFYKEPKGFAGGGIRLFDSRPDGGTGPAKASFRDVEISNNAMLIFPEGVRGAGLPVRCPTSAFADGLFVVGGSLRRGPASG
jgi:SM-20-related protein